MIVVQTSTSDSPSVKSQHHLLELVLVHLAVADQRSRASGTSVAQLSRDQLDVVDAVVHEVDLPAALQLAQDRLADELVVELRRRTS